MLQDLVGDENLPGWINRLATVTSYVPFIGYVLPASWLQPWANDATNQENDSQKPSQTGSFIAGSSTMLILFLYVDVVSYNRTESSAPRSKSYAEKSHVI